MFPLSVRGRCAKTCCRHFLNVAFVSTLIIKTFSKRIGNVFNSIPMGCYLYQDVLQTFCQRRLCSNGICSKTCCRRKLSTSGVVSIHFITTFSKRIGIVLNSIPMGSIIVPIKTCYRRFVNVGCVSTLLNKTFSIRVGNVFNSTPKFSISVQVVFVPRRVADVL